MFSSGKSEGTYFLAKHTLLPVCQAEAAVSVKGTTLSAWLAVWRCSGEDRMDVRQNQGVWGVFSSGKREGYILYSPTYFASSMPS